MAVIIDVESEGTPAYNALTHPIWGGGASSPTAEIFIRFFLGRAREDIRVYDAETGTFVPREGPGIEIPLTRMTKNQYRDLKQASHLLSGRVYHYQIKDKVKNKGADKDNIFGGALWLPG